MMKRKKQKGQGLVEFALILPIMLLVIVGTMEFGRIFLIYATVSNAAREGSRYGMVNPRDTGGITAQVNDHLVATLPENLTVGISYDTGPDGTEYTDPESVAVGHRVIVEVQYRVFALTPIFEPFIPDDFMVDVRNARTIQSLKETIPPPALPPGGGPPPVPTDEFGNTVTPTPMEEPTEPTEEPTDEFGNTLTPTPITPVATPTPRPLAPIIIEKPLWENTNVVRGTAEPNQVLTLRIVQTGYQLSGSVDAAGNFSFSVWPLLVAGHTVIVQGYGTQDLAVVQAPTPTPTLVATPSDSYIYVNPTCTDEQFATITVSGANWSSAAKDMYIYWDDDLDNAVCVASLDKGSFTCTFDIFVTEGAPHVITAVARKSNGSAVDTETTTFERPCPGGTPTPTPSILPDLQISGISLQNPLPLGTYEKLYVTVGVRNVGDTDVSSLFWVDLYADPTGVLTSLGSIDYVAINAIAAGSTVSFTMYVPNGFKEVGNHTLQAMVDTWDQILETDETNNISALLPVTITVSNPAPVPTATPVGTTPPPGNLQGVTYLNTLPQSNVAIYVFAPDGRMVGSGRSDVDGNYIITNVPEGTYTVVGELRLADTLYYGQVTEVTVIAGQTTTGVNIDLVVVP